ncbi:chemotaxis protein CheW [Roseimaritima ulvae]|uniref:CheW-like domain protein n=1 Tax=Roseimaritima ulvae TaxID=980254 RepID=A0A5B9QSH1_9BACT|nr:chemotaxis protein CheW [Roseimaritima ulvae]QEG39986.1 CheW-like domain protein [Roseimaritima ulvae]
MDVEVLVFQAAERLFAVRASGVVEVLRAATLAPFPDADPAVEGVLSLRGSLVPVISIPALLDTDAAPMQHCDHLIVVRMDKATLALRVERAIDLVVLHSDRQSNEDAGQPGNATAMREEWIELVGKTAHGIVYVLDVKRLLSEQGFARVLHLLRLHAASQEVST